jgi:putative Mn2+ efflux pump MntP
MGTLDLLLLAVSLSMDAFAVAVCGGLVLKEGEKLKAGIIFGLWFGIFQALMPTIGYYLGTAFTNLVMSYAHWIALALLGYLGFNMIRGAKESGEGKYDVTDFKFMLTMAVATSIDALAVGVSFAFLQINLPFAVTSIGLTTFTFSLFGCVFGSYIGKWGKEKAEVVGGLVLIGLGLKIVAQHYGLL